MQSVIPTRGEFKETHGLLIIAEYGAEGSKRQHVIGAIPFFKGDEHTVKAIFSTLAEKSFFRGITEVLRKIAKEQNSFLSPDKKIDVKLGAYHLHKTSVNASFEDKTILEYFSRLIPKRTLYAIVSVPDRSVAMYRLPTINVPKRRFSRLADKREALVKMHEAWIKRNTQPSITDRVLPREERETIEQLKKRISAVHFT